jgi:hypothetical protein
MKKRMKKLTLRRETVQAMTAQEIHAAAGAGSNPCYPVTYPCTLGFSFCWGRCQSQAPYCIYE